MNRAFISLYLIIVLSVVLLGLVLNKFWEEFTPVDEVNPAIMDLLSSVEPSLAAADLSSRSQILSEFNRRSRSQLELLSLTDFSNTATLDNIKGGKIVRVSSDNSEIYYKRLSATDTILALDIPLKNPHSNYLYFAFIFIFYIAIALAVFLWIWPLSRDLSRLARHTLHIGKLGQPEYIHISPRSVLSPFAEAFNIMAKRLDEVLCSQKEMTYAVSHELRTPLARVKFALAMLDETQLPALAQKQLDSIHSDTQEMESLINALLTYASFEQESRRLHQSPGHLQDLLRGIVERLPAHSIRIEIDDKTPEGIFNCEWALMQTALQNLLLNALRFASTHILVRLGEEGGVFLVSIEDDGPGVPEEDRKRIFESFVRLHNEPDNRSGFGLGLAIVKRILAWHDGRVYCGRSDLGGAKFYLSWPKKSY